MSGVALSPTYQALLHPWDTAVDSSPPIPTSIEMLGDKWNIDFHEGQGSLSIEVDQGAPRLLVYHPQSDSHLSVRWTPNGFLVEAVDLIQEGLDVTLIQR